MTTYYDFRLKSITIQSFRGFQDPATLDLNASAVVLSGPNGTGKTSVFDAVQWVLLGSIERLQGFWVRRNVEHIVNSYSHRTSGRAEVVLEVAVDGRAVRLCRRGDHKDSTLEIIGAGSSPLFADAAEAWLGKVLASHQPDALAALLTACGLMQQDVMRSVLEAKPADRHEWLGAVLGLGDLEGFEREVKQAAADADNHRKSVEQQVGGAEESVQEATERLEELEYRAEHSASVESAWAEVLAMAGAAPGGMRIEVPDAINSQQAVGMERDARYLSRRMAELFAAFQALKDTEDGLDSEPASEDVEEAARTADETTAAFEKADAEQRRCEELLTVAEEAAKQTARLAAAAVPLLDRTCPVCEQPIDPAQVEKRLREMSSGTSTLVERRQAVEEAAKRARQAEQSKDASQRELASLKACRKQWESARKQEKTLTAELENLAEGRADPSASPPARRPYLFKVRGLRVELLKTDGTEIAGFFARWAAATEQYSEAVAESTEEGDLQLARSQLDRAQALLADRQDDHDRARNRASKLKKLAKAATEARVYVTSQRFKAVEPLIADIYRRLDPHPTFKQLGFEHDVYYGKGRSNPVVRDAPEGVAGDPLIVFSADNPDRH